jgi:hypothetical protein
MIAALLVMLASASLPGAAPVTPETPHGSSDSPAAAPLRAAYCPTPVPGVRPGTFT